MANMNQILALSVVTAFSCTSPKVPETPISPKVQETPTFPKVSETPDCSSINLKEKIGFETILYPEDPLIYPINPTCYKILSRGDNFLEYIGTCIPARGYIGCYRTFAGPNKGEMQLDYKGEVQLDYNLRLILGTHPYHRVFRTSSGRILSVDLPELIPQDAPEKFQVCTELLDLTVKLPNVCKELHDYKLNSYQNINIIKIIPFNYGRGDQERDSL